MDSKISVGYSRVTMTPDEPVPLGGYSSEPKRFHKYSTEDICVTCVAVTDENGETVLVTGLDIINADPVVAPRIRQSMRQATGVEENRIIVCGTHSHSVPAVRCQDVPSIQRYTEKILQWAAQAGREAMADRKPARMFTGSIETHNLNFVKHYKARDNATGELSVIGDCFGSPEGKTLLDHTTVVDPTMHILKFTREGGKDVVIANFRAHPHFTGGAHVYNMSSDYIGAFRMVLEPLMDCHALYLQGACGNTNSSTRLPDERRFTTCRSYGLGLAAAAAECLGKYMTEVQPGRVKTTQYHFYGQINKVPDALVEKAREVYDLWLQTYDFKTCAAAGAPYGVRSPYHAQAILLNLEHTKEKDGGLMILNAVSIGDEFAFVTFPGELFDSISVRMEENSPFPMTMMLGYCHHHIGYLPSAVAYKYTSYETDITRFQAGTGEQVADTYVEMLEELKNGEN